MWTNVSGSLLSLRFGSRKYTIGVELGLLTNPYGLLGQELPYNQQIDGLDSEFEICFVGLVRMNGLSMKFFKKPRFHLGDGKATFVDCSEQKWFHIIPHTI